MQSIVPWLGGKSRLVSTIVPKIDATKHQTYAEAFCGGASIFFNKQESDVEILNDINGDLCNLYRVIQNHLEEFFRYFKWVLVSREEFERLKSMTASAMTDIQRAARYYYMTRTGYAGKTTSSGQYFTVSKTKRPSLNLLRMEEALSEAHLRLARVWIENLPYADFLQRYDKPDTFFYLDPPYHHAEKAYGPTFAFDDFERLRDILTSLQGKFLLSINDTPEMRRIFAAFTIQEVQTSWETRKTNRKVVELLIRNY